jgi:hypothetical protein
LRARLRQRARLCGCVCGASAHTAGWVTATDAARCARCPHARRVPDGPGVWCARRACAARPRVLCAACATTFGALKHACASPRAGLPHRHMSYVEYIEPGMPIFLFNYTGAR